MEIITKNVGGKKYFYLKKSVRKGKRVINKERYLGAEIPGDIDKRMKQFKQEVEKDLYKKLEAIKKHFQAEWKRIPVSAQQKELEEISIAFTYNTNAIEGSTITLAEAREIIHDKISPNKSLRDVRETEAHSEVFLDMLAHKGQVTNKLILEWHKAVFGITKADIAGVFRDYLVRVGPYLAPDWQEVPRMMNELVSFMKTTQKMNPVERAARAHYQFERVHPFGDGNGRVGRLLMNKILWDAGYPMLIIEYTKRRFYYKALQKGEEGFVAYFIRRYLAVHAKRYLK